jgi:acyl-CoA dehydrogenase
MRFPIVILLQVCIRREEGIHYWYKASIYQLYHITHPTMMTEFILQNLLLNSENSKELQYNRQE